MVGRNVNILFFSSGKNFGFYRYFEKSNNTITHSIDILRSFFTNVCTLRLLSKLHAIPRIEKKKSIVLNNNKRSINKPRKYLCRVIYKKKKGIKKITPDKYCPSIASKKIRVFILKIRPFFKIENILRVNERMNGT